MAPATEQSEYGLALARGVREASEEQAPNYGLALVRGVIEARHLGQLPGLEPVDDWAGDELDDTSAQACASSSDAAGRPDTSEAPGQATRLDERGAWGEASTSEAIEQARPLSSEPMDLGGNGSDCRPSRSTLGSTGKSSEPMDLGDNPDPGSTTTPPREAHSAHTESTLGTLGTVPDTTKPEPPVLIPQHGSTGGRKPYNVRLRKALVAEVMDRPEYEGQSLAQVIELALERLLP
jgi:hypothetical protein